MCDADILWVVVHAHATVLFGLFANVILNHTDNKDLKNRGDSYAVKW